MNTKQNNKVAWLSRHAMTADQAADLRHVLGLEPKIETINHTWRASDDADADHVENAATWKDLAESFAAICGVFPQVALEAMCGELPPVYTAISQARPDLRVGEGPIPFVHLRWSRVLPAPYLQTGLQEISNMRMCSEYDCIMSAAGTLRGAGL